MTTTEALGDAHRVAAAPCPDAPVGWSLTTAAWLVLCASLVAVPAHAQGGPLSAAEALADGRRPDLSWSLRSGAWGSTRNLDARRGGVSSFAWAKGRMDMTDTVRLYAEGWAGHRADGRTDHAVLREAYVHVDLSDRFELRAGRQIIAWGRADRLNPTDNLTPRDFRLLVTEDDDQRLGATAVRLAAHVDDLTVSAWWLPRSGERNRLPNPNGLPYRPLRHSHDAAVKIDRSGARVDWSASYYSGVDLATSVETTSPRAGPLAPVFTNRRIRVWGLDAATTVGAYGWRFEAAHVATEDNEARDPLVKNPYVYAVAGAERKLPHDLNLNTQLFFKRVFRFGDAADLGTAAVPQTLARQAQVIADQRDRDRAGYMLRLAGRWLNDTLDVELIGLRSHPRRDSLVRLKASYAFSDHLRLTVGGDRFNGPADSFYGRLRQNNTAYAALSASF